MIMPAPRVLALIGVAACAGVDVWLDGGWGVDALLGAQHREHEDVDLVVPLDQVQHLIEALTPEGFAVAEDYLPTRLVLRTMAGQQIDVHPVTFDSNGDGWQAAAAPDGGDCRYPADGFVTGTVVEQAVRCVGAAVQVEHHRGYAPRPHDVEDMLRLTARYGPPLPSNYKSG